jgi:hypothetical protein
LKHLPAGASAVEHVLQARAAASVRVLVVWEPVLPTDWGAGSPSLTSMVGDRRVVHFWDRERRLSAAMGGPGAVDALAHASEIDFRMKDVIWDVALVYPPGVHWGEKAVALFAPVVDHRDELERALAR